jgi:hypothetical protein
MNADHEPLIETNTEEAPDMSKDDTITISRQELRTLIADTAREVLRQRDEEEKRFMFDPWGPGRPNYRAMSEALRKSEEKLKPTMEQKRCAMSDVFRPKLEPAIRRAAIERAASILSRHDRHPDDA